MKMQKALKQKPGSHAALVLITVDQAGGVSVKEEVANLVGLAEMKLPPTATMVVATQPDQVEVSAGKAFLETDLSEAQILVHVSGQTRKDLLLGLRTIASRRANYASYREIFGGEILLRQEPFGFYTGPDRTGATLGTGAAERVSKIDSGAQAGGSWLLYQLYEYELDSFWEMSATSRRNLVGGEFARKDIQAQVDESQDLPATAHVNVMRAKGRQPEIIRRSFPYREHGKEGLVFLATASDPDAFRVLLKKMARRQDGVLSVTSVLEQGIYFVPAANFAQEQGISPPDLPSSATGLETKDSDDAYLLMEDYVVATAFREFTEQIRDSVFPAHAMSPEAMVLVEAIAALGAGGTLTTPPVVKGANQRKLDEIVRLAEQANHTAQAFNELADQYMTVS